MHLNNKGMSLIELILSFFAFMIIIIGVYNLILDSKETLQDKEIIKNITDYSSFKNDDIHYNLVTNKPFAFVIKKSKDKEFVCSTSYCKISNSNVSINYNTLVKSIGTGLLDKDYCKNLYPCLVYFYDNKGSIGVYTVAFSNAGSIGTGILYGKEKDVSFKRLPNYNEVKVYTDDKDKNKNIYIESKDDLLIINYPYYKDKINYGFKIVYPLEK